MIEIRNICKRFGETVAADDISAVFPDGAITVLIGPSGCGKTTLMKMINRLSEPDSGEIRIRGKSNTDYDPVQLRRSIGYAIQDAGLFPHYSVFENIAVVPRLLGWKKDRIRARVFELLDLVTLDAGYAEAYPAQLSGGEKQRVSLARALAGDPDILLMDEPFGAIDPINRQTIHAAFLEIQEQLKKTIVFVTHDMGEAIKLGDRVAILKNGRLVQFDEPAEILARPADEFTARLLGSDRRIQFLTLKRLRDFLSPEAPLKLPEDATAETAAQALSQSDATAAFVVRESDGRLTARFTRDPESGRISREENPTRLDRNMNLKETLAVMLESGERILPVTDGARRLLGQVELDRLFDEIARF